MMRGFVRNIGRAAVEGVGRLAGRVQENRSLPVDVLEGETEYVVVFDAPGVTHSDVQVRYVKDAVLVRIDRFRDHYEGFEMVYPGRGLSLDGKARLPRDAVVSPSEAQAHLTDRGTLEVHLPKRETRIDVEGDGDEGETIEMDPDEGAPIDSPAGESTTDEPAQ